MGSQGQSSEEASNSYLQMPMIETFPVKDANKAFEHVRARKARYRAVLAV